MIRYACTHASKYVTPNGPDEFWPNGYYTLSEDCNLTAVDLPGLLNKIRKRYALDGPPDHADQSHDDFTVVRFRALENERGDPASEKERAEWEAGELLLFDAKYEFNIEVRRAAQADSAEFEALGLEATT